jgi:hypothetical protein
MKSINLMLSDDAYKMLQKIRLADNRRMQELDIELQKVLKKWFEKYEVKK